MRKKVMFVTNHCILVKKLLRLRNSFIIFFLYLSLSVSGATYYIDPSGSNANNGSLSSPWKTLAYACSQVKTSGDIIHVNAGTYTETTQSALAAGVSIEGTGVSSIIHSNYSSANVIDLASSSTVNGNQSISYLQLEGGSTVSDLVGHSAIRVIARSNVEIHHCTFQNFSTMGVIFYGGANIPKVYPTGNQFHDNIVTNCAKMTPGNGDSGEGALCIGSQQGMLVYNNTITCNLRPSGNNGYCIKYYGDEGLNKGLKIYNNTLTASTSGNAPSGFNFAIEMWSGAGGFEIYNNTIHGTLDISNCYRDLTWYGVSYPEGLYSFGTKIYNNFIGWDNPMPIGSGDGEFGIRLEGGSEYTYIYNNHFKNLGVAIESAMYTQSPKLSQNHMYFYYNIFENIGSSDAVASKGWGIRPAGDIDCIYDNWYVLNNVFIAKTGGASTMYAVGVPGGYSGDVVTNITIRNNIIENFSYAPIVGSPSAFSVAGISIENNIFYNNGNSNAVKSVTTGWTSYVNQNNKLGVNPLFLSSGNFNLQSTSPAINAGLDVGLSSDYAGNAVQLPVDIGAYEYNSSATSPVVPVYQSSVIEDAAPSLLVLTYNSTLASITPAISAYSVLVNSAVRSITRVAISGNKVQLTLASPVVSSDVVSVSYTKPSANPLQTASGGQAASFSAQSVTNKVTSVSPIYVSSAIENATPSLLEMTYTLTLANIVPAVTAFSVLVNSKARTVSKVTISGTKVQLTLASPVVYGDIVTVSYTKPSANPLQTASGGQAVTISAKTVTNNVVAVSLVYVSSAIENATPSLLEMTYSSTLANIIPLVSAFVVLVNSVSRTVSKATISGSKVQLTLASPVLSGDIVTVAYTKPSSNPLQTSTGVQAGTISAQPVTNRITSVIPVYVSSSIENATPALLEMTYNVTLANIVPAISAFTVLINSKARTISKITISGTKVQLTLASPVVYGDIVTVSYTKPSKNPLQTTTGGQAATFSAKTVTNRVASANPLYVNSSIENATPSLLEMTYNLSLANKVPATSAFTVLVNSQTRAVTKVAVSGTRVQLTLGSPVIYGDFVTVAYRKPSSNPLQTATGAQAATITAQIVTNNVSPVIPAYVSSVIQNATPAMLEMTYNLNLANIVPSSSSFTVQVNSTSRNVTGVAVSGAKVQLSLESPVSAGDAVTVSYTVPAGNPLQSATGGIAASISNQAVSNNIANISPVVAITSPVDNTPYASPASITIKADASDPDGSVTMVEFYNGSTLIGSMSAAPYSFDWIDIGDGVYTLTAIATDNKNAKTTSSAITISVTTEAVPVNLPPVVSISSPSKGKEYDNPASIDIKIDASDPDGTISKVVLYNGSSELVQLTTAPYIYTWKDVSTGTYAIKAVAYDNMDATTTSSSIEFKVGGGPIYDANSEIINLYPNPTQGNFSIEFLQPLKDENLKVVITDLGGIPVSNQPVMEGETLMHFDLGYIKSGIYIMMVVGKDILVTKKFIKN
jgi:uncharacterized repeat protein (TIGR02059 family)